MKEKSAMAKARKLAKKFDITVEFERAIDVWWVYGADYIYIHNGNSKFPVDSRDDPLCGNHNCTDAWDVVGAAERLWALKDAGDEQARELYNAWQALGAALAHAKGYLRLGEA